MSNVVVEMIDVNNSKGCFGNRPFEACLVREYTRMGVVKSWYIKGEFSTIEKMQIGKAIKQRSKFYEY